jgi:hypothetical protein
VTLVALIPADRTARAADGDARPSPVGHGALSERICTDAFCMARAMGPLALLRKALLT